MAPVAPAPSVAIDEASRLMAAFAGRTGLVPGIAPKRYLWTDAFAVCNFLALAGCPEWSLQPVNGPAKAQTRLQEYQLFVNECIQESRGKRSTTPRSGLSGRCQSTGTPSGRGGSNCARSSPADASRASSSTSHE